jgi:hypothetical protein
MNEDMSDSAFALGEAKVYRVNLAYRIYHLVFGAAVLVGAVLSYHLLPLSVVLALFSVFLMARPFVAAVTLDQYSVTLKTMFSERSLQRSSITAIERLHTGRANYLVLWGNLEEKVNLTINYDVFAFDEGWDHWLSTFRDLSDDKPLSLF